ncbi:MAG: histone deacetylase [Candidatus Aminicenantaceae bacterium]
MVPLINMSKLFWKKRFPFKFVYSDKYWIVDIGEHVFPVEKYRLVYEKLLHMGAKRENFLTPQPPKEEDLFLVHTPKYLKKLKTGALSHSEILTLELPYSPELLEFALLFVGGTILAAERALEDGLAVHIGGGFHHAFPDHGEGFCVLNDVAVSLEKVKQEGKVQKAMVVDCDLHQGNGTAFIFSKKDYAFTFSMHQMDLYPAQKPSSSLDVGLWSGDGDKEYLEELRLNFPRLYQKFQPDLVFYLAGADPYEKDQLGSLRVTIESLKERDRIVIEEARKLHIPVVILFAGGYAHSVSDTVSIHLNTIKVAQKIQGKYF